MIRSPQRLRRRHRCRRAFTISELLIAIGVLGLFAAAATQLFYATFRTGQSTAQQQDAAGAFDSAISALRADVWVASEIAAPQPTTARLAKVTWTIKETALTRDAGDGSHPRTWQMPKGATFAAEGASLVLRTPAAAGERGGEIRMVSQPLTLAKLASS